MSKNGDSYFEKAMERVNADQEGAVMFLAKIIPKEDKERIRRNIEKDPDFATKQHMFLGMKVRNALRTAGFFYDPYTMDGIWFSWLHKAVCLAEDQIVVTDSVKERIEKYQASIERPPVCPKLEAEEFRSMIEQIEERHKIKLSEVEIRYSDNIRSAFCISPTILPSEETISGLYFVQERIRKFYRIRKSELKLKGLTDSEIEGIDPSKYTIFLPRRYSNYSAGLYGAVWHELGHIVASVLGIKAKIPNESVAIAYSFRGLLQEAKEGKLPLEKVFDQIELYIEKTQEPLTRALMHYGEALFAIRKHIPYLKFRNRDPNELLMELDKTIEYTLAYPFAYREGKWRYEKYFVSSMALVAVILFILSLVLRFL